jgi:hypothetical protein
MKSKYLIAIVSFMLMLSSCEDNESENIICTLNFVNGLDISLIEKSTGNIITGNVKIVAEDDNYTETMQSSENNASFTGAGERKGTYILTVTSDNYKTFISESITVNADECHVFTESRTFELELK